MILFGNSNISPHILATIPLLYGFPAALPEHPGARIAPPTLHPTEADRCGIILPPAPPSNSPSALHRHRPDCLPSAARQTDTLLPSATPPPTFRRNRSLHHCNATSYLPAAAPSVCPYSHAKHPCSALHSPHRYAAAPLFHRSLPRRPPTLHIILPSLTVRLSSR